MKAKGFWLGVTMMAMVGVDVFLIAMLKDRGWLLSVSSVLFVLAWIVQVYGHKVEGENPSFLKNAVFLLIGPVWVNRELAERLFGRRAEN